MVKQSSNTAENEVLSFTNYSPSGLELGGSHQNISHQFNYKFNGKEENGFSDLTDFGARYLDKYASKWTSLDAYGGFNGQDKSIGTGRPA